MIERFDTGRRGAGVAPSQRRAVHGFTLIELMIAVAIVAILAAIAYPSYTESVRKGKRGQAKADLVEAAQIAERWHTIQRTYQGLAAGDQIVDQSPKTGTPDYTIAVAPGTTQNTFKITATPTGGQASDRCGVLSINERGEKKHSTGSDSQCQFGTTGT